MNEALIKRPDGFKLGLNNIISGNEYYKNLGIDFSILKLDANKNFEITNDK